VVDKLPSTNGEKERTGTQKATEEKSEASKERKGTKRRTKGGSRQVSWTVSESGKGIDCPTGKSDWLACRGGGLSLFWALDLRIYRHGTRHQLLSVAYVSLTVSWRTGNTRLQIPRNLVLNAAVVFRAVFHLFYVRYQVDMGQGQLRSRCSKLKLRWWLQLGVLIHEVLGTLSSPTAM
jgi:hypothetical protein